MEYTFLTKDYIDKSQKFLNMFRMNSDAMQKILDKSDGKYIVFTDQMPYKYYYVHEGSMLLIADEYGNPMNFFSEDALRNYLSEFGTDDEVEKAVEFYKPYWNRCIEVCLENY